MMAQLRLSSRLFCSPKARQNKRARENGGESGGNEKSEMIKKGGGADKSARAIEPSKKQGERLGQNGLG